jgi:hypothetical protein
MEQILQEAVDHIKSLENLSDDEKKAFIGMIENGEDPVDVLDKVEDAIQEKIDDIFDKAGAKLDENDPEYQAKQKEMMDGIQVAEDEFNGEMESINSEAKKIEDEASEEIDKIKIEAINLKMSE